VGSGVTVALALTLLLTGSQVAAADDEPMTHALLSYADPAYLDVLRESARPNGWGLTYAWDAYDDGSENPDSTAYAITTALVLQAFLDAGEVGPAERAIAQRWSRCCFSDGFYWYSDQPADAIFTPNVTSMMASVMYRLGYTEQAEEAFQRMFQDGPRWLYSDGTGDWPNDLLHHGYTLWGIERYRDAGGQVPWSRAELLATLDGSLEREVWPAAAVAVRRALCHGPEPYPEAGNPREAAHLVWSAAMERRC
jgi:hypothetical protein